MQENNTVTFRYTICSNLGQLKSLALPLFHSLRGCDKTSHVLEVVRIPPGNTRPACRCSPTHYWFAYPPRILVASFVVPLHSKDTHLQQGLWCRRLTRTSSPHHWKQMIIGKKMHLLPLTHNPDIFSLESVHVHWIESLVVLIRMKGCDTSVSNRQGIVSSPLEGGHGNIYHLHELHCSNM